VTAPAGERVPDLSLVVPCYQEAGHLRESVAAVVETLDATRLDYEIVFVDDASRDTTRSVIEEICATRPRCRALFHPENRGRGAAFKTGYAASCGRVTGFLDIDLEVAPHYIPPLFRLVDGKGFDVATGYRHYLLRQTGALHRHFASQAYRFVCRILLGFGIRDSETGCKFFRRETATQVVLGSESDGWFWDTEVLARAALADLRIVEMPVLFLRRSDKRSTVRLLRDARAYLVELHRFRGKVGLGLVTKSPIYWTGIGYEWLMRALYGRGYRALYRSVADHIPAGSRVVDVCAGPGTLWHESLREKGTDYLALDFNGHFVMSARRRGARARWFDLRREEVPEADHVVLGSSLYHFRPREDELLARLLRAARRSVIVTEPVENLSARGPRWLRRLGARLTDPGSGAAGSRFDLAAFEAFAKRNGAAVFDHAPGARNALAVFEK
jgi:glycosyltransferase involved in cell wall biosynthesis